MITGATDGIGHALAEELLRRGFNVVIHGRNPEKLNRIRSAFLEQFPAREIQIWAADATGEHVDYNEIVQIVRALPGKLTILINNVGGVPPPALATLEEATAEHINTIISLNTRFTAILTSRLLPVLKANSPSAIVCSGSGGALVGMPYIVTYGASKAFVHAFCNSLKAELASPDENEKAAGVNVNALVIGQVSTANSGVPPSFFVLRPDEFASAALHKIGCSQTQVAGHWRHALQSLIMTTLPESLLIRMALKLLKERRAEERRESKNQGTGGCQIPASFVSL